jgi:serine/threonine-protein kinase RsbW
MQFVRATWLPPCRWRAAHGGGRCVRGHRALPGGVAVCHNRPIPTDLEIALDGSVSELERLAAEVAGFCQRHNLDDSVEFDLNLVLEELFTNTVRHGGLRDQPNAARIRMRAAGNGVEVEYRDRGVAFNPLDAPEADVHQPLIERRPGGLGIHLVRQIMRDVSYRRADGENELTMVRRIELK